MLTQGGDHIEPDAICFRDLPGDRRAWVIERPFNSQIIVGSQHNACTYDDAW